MKKKIKQFTKKRKYSPITRRTSKHTTKISEGYIINHSNSFLLLEEINDFQSVGFNIFQVKK